MKCETTNTILTIVLGLLVMAGAFFAVQTFFLTKGFRQLTVQATFSEPGTYVLRSLADDGALTGYDDVTVVVER